MVSSGRLDIPQGRRNIAPFAFLTASIWGRRYLLLFVVAARSARMSIFLSTTSGFGYISAH